MRIILLVFSFLVFNSFGQRKHSDNQQRAFLLGLTYKASLPGGDFAKRWGFNNALGLDFTYKFQNNFTVGLNGAFLFGNTLRDTTIFSGLYNAFGTITAMSSGGPADVKFLLRGASGHGSVGYVWNRFGNNANSGIWFDVGFGFITHKIRIESLLDNVPQLEGDYRKGYDKLTMGFSSRQFIGYLYQADRRLFRLYAGFEFMESLTKNVRTYNFDMGGADNTLKKEFNVGFKVGWIVPIKQRTTNAYYVD